MKEKLKVKSAFEKIPKKFGVQKSLFKLPDREPLIIGKGIDLRNAKIVAQSIESIRGKKKKMVLYLLADGKTTILWNATDKKFVE